MITELGLPLLLAMCWKSELSNVMYIQHYYKIQKPEQTIRTYNWGPWRCGYLEWVKQKQSSADVLQRLGMKRKPMKKIDK